MLQKSENYRFKEVMASPAQLTSGSMMYQAAHFDGNTFWFLRGATTPLSISVDASTTAGIGFGFKFTPSRALEGESSAETAGTSVTLASTRVSDSEGKKEGERTSTCKARLENEDIHVSYYMWQTFLLRLLLRRRGEDITATDQCRDTFQGKQLH
jgi:hypothetical protein